MSDAADDNYLEYVTTKYDDTGKSFDVSCDFCYKDDFSPTCAHTDRYIREGLDAEVMEPETAIGLNALMSIGKTDTLGWVRLVMGPELVGGASLITLEYTADTSARTTQVLGIRNVGEGRYILAGVVMDWILSRSAPDETFTPGAIKTKCKSPMHNFASQKVMQKMCDNKAGKNLNLFSMALEGCCYVCYNESNKNNDNYGLDDLDDRSFQKKFASGGIVGSRRTVFWGSTSASTWLQGWVGAAYQ